MAVTEVHRRPFGELGFRAEWGRSSHRESGHPGLIREEDRREHEVITEEGDRNDPKPL